jgi:N-carbamoyl-L-amino-acid hydrolase
VELSVDLRDLDAAVIERFDARIRQEAHAIAKASGTMFTITESVSSTPAISDDRLMEAIDRSAASLALTGSRLPSGAGHDAQEMAQIAPMAMIFVPSVGGISHSPREFTKAQDVANGVDVLLNSVVAADRL